MGFCYELKNALGFNPQWNEMWIKILNERNKTEFSIKAISEQYDKEWNEWIKKNPEKSENTKKPELIWVKAIHNFLDENLGGDFLLVFGAYLIPSINKKKNKKLIVSGLEIEQFLEEIRNGEWILNAKTNPFMYNTIEFMVRGMEKGLFYI
jgi:hypothetical protein